MSVSSESDTNWPTDEASYNNFAATSTTNYMTTSRHRNLAEVSSSNSSIFMQSSSREEASDDTLKNGNGSMLVSPFKKTARLLRARRVAILKQRKQIAALQHEVDIFKQVLTRMSADGLLTETYRQHLESSAPEAAKILKDLIVPDN